MPPTGQVDFSSLSNEQLSQMLVDYGVDVGPINEATRRTYERKLLKLKTGSEPTARYQSVDNDDDDNEVTLKRTSEHKVFDTRADVATSPNYPASKQYEENLSRRPDISSRPAPVPFQTPQVQQRKGKESEFTSPRIESRPSLSSNRGTATSYSTPVTRPNPTKVSQEKARSTPLWLKVLLLAVALVLLYLIYANMEPQAKSNIPGIQNKIEV
jgi:hypothetical protein